MAREERTIEVTLLSAIGLKRVTKRGKEQKYYAVAYIYPARSQTIPADPHGEANPVWNSTVKLTCYETDLHQATGGAPAVSSSSPTSSLIITIQIYGHHGGIFHSSDELVGTVKVPLQDVASAAEAGGAMAPFKVLLPSGEVQGTLSLSTNLGAKRELGEDEDLTTSPLPSHSNDQEDHSLIYPMSSDKVRTRELASSDTREESSYGDYSTKKETSGTNAALDEDEHIVIGYPAPGYMFEPLGQLPPDGEERGPETSSAGHDATHLPKKARHRGLRELIRGRRERRRDGEGGGEDRGVDYEKRHGPLRVGMTILGGVFWIIAAAAP